MVTQPGGVGTAFHVAGSHTYSQPNQFPAITPYAVQVSIVDVGGATAVASTTANIQAVTFRVAAFTPNASGFDVQFSRAADISVINLYQGLTTAASLPDVVVTGPTNNVVHGTLVYNPATNTASWVATGGVLPAGAYSATFFSRADGWKDVRSGQLLDGNADGVIGINDNYVTTFTAAAGGLVVSLPDFARGPGQPVNTPATGANLPVFLSTGAGVTSLSLTVTYNSALLNVSSASLGASVPAGWTMTSDLTVAGQVTLTASGATSLPSGKLDVFDLVAGVPATATYGAGEVLRIGSLLVNGGALPATADQAVHKTAFLGDATGNRTHSSMDAALVARVSVGLDTGFDSFPLTDPVIVGDVSGNGSISSLDAAYIAQKAVGRTVVQIPDLPAGNVAVVPTHGLDPVVSMPSLAAKPGETVHAPVAIDGATGLLSLDLDLGCDTTILDLSDKDLALTGVAAHGWGFVSSVDDQTGKVKVVAWTTTPFTGSGQMVDLAFHVAPVASGWRELSVNGELNEGQLPITAILGALAVQADVPAPAPIVAPTAGGPWPAGVAATAPALGLATVPRAAGPFAWRGIPAQACVLSVTAASPVWRVPGKRPQVIRLAQPAAPRAAVSLASLSAGPTGSQNPYGILSAISVAKSLDGGLDLPQNLKTVLDP